MISQCFVRVVAPNLHRIAPELVPVSADTERSLSIMISSALAHFGDFYSTDLGIPLSVENSFQLRTDS